MICERGRDGRGLHGCFRPLGSTYFGRFPHTYPPRKISIAIIVRHTYTPPKPTKPTYVPHKAPTQPAPSPRRSHEPASRSTRTRRAAISSTWAGCGCCCWRSSYSRMSCRSLQGDDNNDDDKTRYDGFHLRGDSQGCMNPVESVHFCFTPQN